jgi:hypothetical protein
MGFTKSGDPFVSYISSSRYRIDVNLIGWESKGRRRKGDRWTIHCRWLYGTWYDSSTWMVRQRLIACCGVSCLVVCSAEALAALLWSDIENSTWTPPEWLPRHYLTEAF